MSRRKTNKSPGDLELRGTRLETTLGVLASERAAPRTVIADFKMHLDLAPAAESDDFRFGAFDWWHLLARLRSVAAAHPRRLAEALARDLMPVLLAEDRVHWAEITLRVPASNPDDGDLCVTYRAEQTREDPPVASKAMKRRVRRMQFFGTLLKAFARLYHAVFPQKRFVIPPVDPARPGTPPADESSPIPRIIWQTNFTDRYSLPLWFNHRRNRRLSPEFEHRHVSTEDRLAYIKAYAPERVQRAYERLTDGAAQADLWRLFVLYREGGVYMDIDASLVRPLGDIVAGRKEVRLWNRKRYTNYFMATVPGNPLYGQFIDIVVENIERHPGGDAPRVFYSTGPGALEVIMDRIPPDYVPHRECCVQGVFSNERFQYIDRPGTKWTHKSTWLADKA